jgi:hypothetical protein
MTQAFYRVDMGAEVRHELYRDYPGDEYWTGYNDLDTMPLLKAWKQLTIVTEQSEALPDWFDSGGKPIISASLRAACEEMNIVAEYLPVVIIHRGSIVKPNYWILHPLERIPCIDIANSDFEMYGKPPNFTVKRYKKLTFIDRVVSERHLFRPQHDPAIYASSAFRRLCESRHLTVLFANLPGHTKNAA